MRRVAHRVPGFRAVALGALLAGDGTSFRGCSDAPASPGDSGAAPFADGAPACTRDDDCAPTDCTTRRCIAGACLEVGPLASIDEDGDGRARPPCGDDCDDTDPTVVSGGAERCDGRDSDCDGRVDEGASARIVERDEATVDARADLFSSGDRAWIAYVQGEPSAPSVAVAEVTGDEALGPARDVLRPGDEVVIQVAAAVDRRGRWMLAVLDGAGAIAVATYELRADGLRNTWGPVSLGTGAASEIRLGATPTGFALLARHQVGDTSDVWRDVEQNAVTTLATPGAPVALAVAATRLVVANGPRSLEVVELETGAVRQAALRDALVGGPLAAVDDRVFVATRSAVGDIELATLEGDSLSPVAFDPERSSVRVELTEVPDGFVLRMDTEYVVLDAAARPDGAGIVRLAPPVFDLDVTRAATGTFLLARPCAGACSSRLRVEAPCATASITDGGPLEAGSDAAGPASHDAGPDAPRSNDASTPSDAGSQSDAGSSPDAGS